jgi:hypothetical protein
MGLRAGDLVQQLGELDGIDQAIVDDIVAVTGEEFVGSESDDIVDVVLLWFREGDGDLVDTLVDARRQLEDSGAIWLLTPKATREGHVEAADILESVATAGLAETSTVSLGTDWNGVKLTAPKGPRNQRR